jgi:hypothetical protein
MKIYRISPQSALTERSKALRRSTFIMTTAILVGFLASARFLLEINDLRVMFGYALFVGLLLTVALWRSSRQTSRYLEEAYSSFEIADDNQTWTKKQKNSPDVTLAHSEVVRVEELVGKGFRICTAERNKNIWVPCELEDYEQLKSEVQALAGVAFTSKPAAWLRTYLTLGVLLALTVVSVIPVDRRIAGGASLLVAGWLLFSVLNNYRNPNFTTRTKRRLIWSGLVASCFLVRAVVLWGS